MKVGLIKETKNNENRVALTPTGAGDIARAGHEVLVERGAGENSGFPDKDYEAAGCRIVDTADAWSARLILKIKEPLAPEYAYFEEGQIIFTYFHLAGVDPALTRQLLSRKVTAIAYETVRDHAGALPLLAPMSAVAGTMSVSVASHYLACIHGGKGVLLGSIMGRPHGKVVILGDGVVGRNAARTAVGIGAETCMLARHEDRFALLRKDIGTGLHCLLSTPDVIAEQIKDADAVIGAVLRPGARAPGIVSEEMVAAMEPGSVVVDVSIDQGGCIETSRPTSHSDPIFRVHDVVHYCVTNMPGAYPTTSTWALTEATLPYVSRLACDGLAAVKADAGLAEGVNTHQGALTNEAVANAHDLMSFYRPLTELL